MASSAKVVKVATYKNSELAYISSAIAANVKKQM